MSRETTDPAVRSAAFAWLRRRAEERGQPIFDFRELERGFEVGGEKVTLVSVQGIWTPRLCAAPISVRTATPRRNAPRPYEDTFSEGLASYKYFGTDPDHLDNARLRQAMRQGVPLVYFLGVVGSRYLAVWPVFVVHDDPENHEFRLRIHESLSAAQDAPWLSPDRPDPTTEDEVSETLFRERVLDAYRTQCAVCRLQVRGLLGAARIWPRSEGGQPLVDNGMALCELHRAAFDRMFLGIRPDFTVEVRREVLDHPDDSPVRRGLSDIHGSKIAVPRRENDRPDPLLLAMRLERFRQAPLHL